MANPLLDNDFLENLFAQRLQEKYVKIILLDLKENPIEEIQGRATAGSVNVDGSSACRRTCSLTIVANELNIHEYYWGLHSKFQIYVGLKNNINNDYDDIIWFKQGIFLITSFNTTQSTNNWQISISGKDKMCLLNGDIGGNITALSYDFGKIDTVNTDGTITTDDYLIKNIIREGVHTFGNEPYHNIIINDLDEAALELLEYRGNVNGYLITGVEDGENANIIFDDTATFYTFTGEEKTIAQFFESDSFNPYTRLSIEDFTEDPTPVYDENGKKWYLSKIEPGEVIGYRSTELTYAGDFIGSVGESFTSACLDKIVSMLGEYEYFYNIDGQFVFQKKPNYVNSSWNNIKTDAEGDIYAEGAAYSSSCSWFFDNTETIISMQNTPKYDNLKNDFIIWGVKGDSSVAIHMRYAIDKKPKYYKNISGIIYCTESYNLTNEKIYNIVDWREVLYQMAYDYYHYAVLGEDDNKEYLDEYLALVKANNPEFYPTGYTGYEQYYMDIYSFWRTLYDPEKDYTYNYAYITEEKYNNNTYYWFERCEDLNNYPFDSNYTYYYYNVSTLNYSKKSNLSETEYQKSCKDFYILRCNKTSVDKDGNYFTFDANNSYYIQEETNYNKNGWNNDIINNPENLLFWFDFLDSDNTIDTNLAFDLEKYNVQRIGDRPKAENNDKLKSMYFEETPTIIFYTENDTDINKQSGYKYLKLTSDLEPYFYLSSQGSSIKDELDNLLYKYTYCTESISVTCIPIYTLQPNTRIFIKDINSGINGQYIIKSLTIPLTYNGTMSISATKAVERIN